MNNEMKKKVKENMLMQASLHFYSLIPIKTIVVKKSFKKNHF